MKIALILIATLSIVMKLLTQHSWQQVRGTLLLGLVQELTPLIDAKLLQIESVCFRTDLVQLMSVSL